MYNLKMIDLLKLTNNDKFNTKLLPLPVYEAVS